MILQFTITWRFQGFIFHWHIGKRSWAFKYSPIMVTFRWILFVTYLTTPFISDAKPMEISSEGEHILSRLISGTIEQQMRGKADDDNTVITNWDYHCNELCGRCRRQERIEHIFPIWDGSPFLKNKDVINDWLQTNKRWNTDEFSL